MKFVTLTPIGSFLLGESNVPRDGLIVRVPGFESISAAVNSVPSTGVKVINFGRTSIYKQNQFQFEQLHLLDHLSFVHQFLYQTE